MAWGVAAAAIPAALSLAGTGAKAKGQVQSGNSNAALYGYQAQVARRNAAVNKMRADRAEQAGIAGADISSLQGANTLGTVKARQGASGVDVNSGSAVDVRADIAKANKFTAANVLRNAELTAYGYRRQADNDEAQGGIYDAAASGALKGSGLAAGGTLLEGASSLPWGWLKGLGGGTAGDAAGDAAIAEGLADVGTGIEGSTWAEALAAGMVAV